MFLSALFRARFNVCYSADISKFLSTITFDPKEPKRYVRGQFIKARLLLSLSLSLSLSLPRFSFLCFTFLKSYA